MFPQLFRVLPNFHECFYNSIETRSTCFLFLLENNATKKGKQLVNSNYQNVNSLCSRHHYVTARASSVSPSSYGKTIFNQRTVFLYFIIIVTPFQFKYIIISIISQYQKYHNTFCFSLKSLRKHFFNFLLGLTMVPRGNFYNYNIVLVLCQLVFVLVPSTKHCFTHA